MIKGSIEWEHSPEEGFVLRIKPPCGKMIDSEVCKHIVAARREMLMALRGVLDIAIERMDEKDKKAEKHGTKIEVQ